MPGPVITVNELGLPTLPAVQLFNDTFDSGLLDTTNRWFAMTSGGGSIATVIGSSTLSSGTTAGGFALLASLPSFRPTEPGFLIKVARINIENPVILNTYRFFGLATYTTPTIAIPVIEAAGFEIGADGRLYAVTYQTGTRVIIANLSQSAVTYQGVVYQPTKVQPQDPSAHKYFVNFRGDYIVWAIDDPGNTVAEIQTGANGPNANTLAVVQLCMSAGSAAAAPLVLNGVAVSDNSRTTVSIADAVFGWRKQSVTAAGNAMVQLGVPAVIGLVGDSGNSSSLRTDGAGRLLDANEDLLRTLIREVRVTNRLLLLGLNVDGGDLEALNQDSDYD